MLSSATASRLAEPVMPPRAAEIVTELQQARQSERQGRLIDGDEEASMERKKREGYF